MVLRGPADTAPATGPDVGTDDEPLNLKQVARALGVHYMTAYRYVRQGLLPATMSGNVWLVERVDVAAFADRADGASRRRAAGPSDPAPGTDWVTRLQGRLLAGDEVGAWSVVSQALGGGLTPQRCLLDVVSPAMVRVGSGVASGALTIADQYVASATAQRIVVRVGARFRRAGRSRGTVVLGAPAGERHALPITIVADLVRMAGFAVVELGADVPPEAFGLAARRATAPVAVGIGVTGVDYLDAARATIARVRAEAPGVPVLLGGQAVRNPEVASLVGVAEWAADGHEVVLAIERLAARRRARPQAPPTPHG
jgi:excisionase family DNA binding protein